MKLNLDELESTLPEPETANPANGSRARARSADMDADSADAFAAKGAFLWCLSQHESHHGSFPMKGGRNHYLAALALFCNERGVEQYEVEDHALSNWQEQDFDDKEIRTTVQGIYQRERANHGSKPYEAPRPKAEHAQPSQPKAATGEAAAPLQTPTIPQQVYENLPRFLQQCCTPFLTDREQDVMLISTFAVLSGCFPTLSGTYDGATVGANLFCFVVAPAANGKGGLTWARRLAYQHHQSLVIESKTRMAEYALELEQYQQQKRSSSKGSPLLASAAPIAPEEPSFKQLYIPANSSASGMIKVLADNDGRGIICETEADTVSGAIKQDWGNYSDLWRKAFHHESYTYQRKTGKEFYELPAPAISIALTGTPGQVQKLIPSAEDGLYSRFLFYAFETPHTWRDVSPSAGRGNLTAYFDGLATNVSRMILIAAQGPIRVELTPDQWEQLNEAGTQWLASAIEQCGEDSGSVVKRLGLSVFRMAMLLTLLRAFDNGEQPGRMVCEQTDFDTALMLADVCLAHSLALFERMPKQAPMVGKHTAKATKEAKVLELHRQGLSLRDIQAKTGVPFQTAARWIAANK